MKKQLFSLATILVAIALSSCSSDESAANTEPTRTPKQLTIRQDVSTKTDEGGTRSILTDNGEKGLSATWEMGDEMSVYNKTYSAAGFETVTAQNSSKNTSFTGEVTCEKNDELRLFYPAVAESGSVTTSGNGNLTLDISNQKGTLEDIQLHYDFNYGSATVESVTDNQATANAGSTKNLMAICKIRFKVGNGYIDNIKDVYIVNVPTTATFSLSARYDPEMVVDTKLSTLSIEYSNGSDKPCYIALFPGETQPTVYAETEDGKIYTYSLSKANLNAGKYYNLTLSMKRTNIVVATDWLKVCGIKWAKGNLLYNSSSEGDVGFMSHWSIAKNQCYFADYNNSTTHNVSSNTEKDHYTWGQLDVSSSTEWVPGEDGTYYISKKLYTKGTTETTKFESAKFGDLAYWASYGKFRLPTNDEMNSLMSKASIQYGSITYNGVKIYGILFTDPMDGSPVKNGKETVLTDEDLSKGLFLPCAGEVQGDIFRGLPDASHAGSYMLSRLWKSGGDYQYSCLQLSKNDTYYTNDTVYPLPKITYDSSGYKYSIRPIYNGE